MKTYLLRWSQMSIFIICLTLNSVVISCGNDNNGDPNGNYYSIVGQWGDEYETLTFNKDGSYREDGSLGQYRIGTYSYNSSSSLLVVNIKAIAGMNSAYQTTYIVQTLSSRNLVLMYTDGDVKGFYTRK